MNKKLITVFALSVTIATSFPIATHAVITEIAGSATTGVVLKQLFSDLTTMINKARDDGDYLLARAGVEAKDALDVWQRANSSLLEKAFSELDNASRENFARAHQLISSANTGIANRLETAQQIMENANQIVESIPLGSNQAYVLRFSPRIRPPQASEKFTVRIRGVNLDKADPRLQLTDSIAERNQPGPLEAQFSVPVTELPQDATKMQVRSFKLTYSTPSDNWFARLFGVRNEVSRELPIISLPATLATYQVTATRRFDRKETMRVVEDIGSFRGRNTEVRKVARPREGWQWDVTDRGAFTVHQGLGEAAGCNGIDWNASSANGITIVAHTNEIKNSRYPLGADAFVHCRPEGPWYRMVQTTETLLPESGSLSWKSDKEIPLPPDTVSLRLVIKTFDGREKVFTGTGTDYFLDVRREPGTIIVTPKVPEDIM